MGYTKQNSSTHASEPTRSTCITPVPLALSPMSRVGEDIEHELTIISNEEGRTSSWMSPSRQEQDGEVREPADPPSNAVSDSTPSRNYQALLLLSGFLMIFWIIGLNSVYGVFQASQR